MFPDYRKGFGWDIGAVWPRLVEPGFESLVLPLFQT